MTWILCDYNFAVFHFKWSSCYSIFSFMLMFYISLFVLLYFFFWPLCCLFFDIRILTTPLVSSNSSWYTHIFGETMQMENNKIVSPHYPGNNIHENEGEGLSMITCGMDYQWLRVGGIISDYVWDGLSVITCGRD